MVQKVNAEFSKHKLQTKAKLASLNQQLEQAQKSAADVADKVCSHCIYIILLFRSVEYRQKIIKMPKCSSVFHFSYLLCVIFIFIARQHTDARY